jgi:hypothetical protein
MTTKLVRGDRRGRVLLAGGLACLLGMALPVAAQAGAKKVITYRATSASLKVVNSAKATLSNGDTWEGEDTFVWKGRKDKQADLIVVGKPPYQVSVDSKATTTGFEILTKAGGSVDDCSGPHEAFTFSQLPFGPQIERAGKKGKFEATWSFNATVPSENCGISYGLMDERPSEVVKEDEKLGDKKLVLKTSDSLLQLGSDPDSGVTSYQHTTTWNGEVVLKKGGAVAG